MLLKKYTFLIYSVDCKLLFYQKTTNCLFNVMSMSDFLWIVSSCQIKEIKEKQRKGKERKVKKVRNAGFSPRWREVY